MKQYQLIWIPKDVRAPWPGYTEATGIMQISREVREKIEKNWWNLVPSKRYLHTNI